MVARIRRFITIALVAHALMAFSLVPSPDAFLSRRGKLSGGRHRRVHRLHYSSNDDFNKGETKSLLAQTQSNRVDASNSSKSTSTTLAKPTTEGPTLSLLLDNMPTNEKYNILLQSYATKIMSQQTSTREIANRNNQTLMNTMENLYIEMMQKSIKIERKTAQYMIDASSAFADTVKIGRSLQLIKATGTIKAFGVAIGQLSDKQVARSGRGTSEIPTDNRVEEVLWFTGVVASTVSWFGLELYSKFNDDLHPFATLFGCACALVVAYDVVTRKGEGLRLATKGFDRLILRDDERAAHCDSASFLVGYLLGLPCYPYKPDILESVKMLMENPSSLQVYKQPRAFVAEKRNAGKKQSSSSSSSFFSSFLPSTTRAAAEPASSTADRDIKIPEMSDMLSTDSNARNEESVLGLGRVLVWLLSPVAAEAMRYGESIISEPRQASRLLSVLESLQTSPGSSSSGAAAAEALYRLPKNAEEQAALLEWAYYESTQIVKIHGDVLEELREMLLDSTSSVGECTLFLEEEISS